MNRHWFGLVLLLVWFTMLPTDGQPEHIKPRYRKFLSQHVFPAVTVDKCTDVIRDRDITEGDTNNCKEKNTFVTDYKKRIRDVCDKAGTRRAGDRNLYDSNKPFPVVICKLRSPPKKHPHCEYRGVKDTRYITIACADGWPVHYDADIIDV